MCELPESPPPSKEKIQKEFQEMLERQMAEASKFASMVYEKQTTPILHHS
jgi:hypothetical protein